MASPALGFGTQHTTPDIRLEGSTAEGAFVTLGANVATVEVLRNATQPGTSTHSNSTFAGGFYSPSAKLPSAGIRVISGGGSSHAVSGPMSEWTIRPEMA
jgi:hypothetical protein